MSEIHDGPSQEEVERVWKNLEDKATKEQENAQYEQWMKDHPDTVIDAKNLRECEPEIAEFEAMLESFELTHSLEELYLIIDLRPEDAPKYPLRESAKAALIPIVKLMNTLKAETNISPERHDELKAKYMRLSRAVGIINNNKVDHNRRLPSEYK